MVVVKVVVVVAVATVVRASFMSTNLLMCFGGRDTRPERVREHGNFNKFSSDFSATVAASTLSTDLIVSSLRGRPRRRRLLLLASRLAGIVRLGRFTSSKFFGYTR